MLMEKAPTDYSKSKIYTIRSHQTDKYYIGSTTQPLAKRFSKHNETYVSYLTGKGGKVTSYDLLALGDAYIELLEEYPCANKEQLHKREGELIRQHKAQVVNIAIPCRDKATWYQDNKAAVLKKRRERYEQNIEKVKLYGNEKHECACGRHYTTRNKARHMKSTKHVAYENSQKLISKIL